MPRAKAAVPLLVDRSKPIQVMPEEDDIYLREEEERVDLDDLPPKPWVVFRENYLICYLCETFKHLEPPVELEAMRTHMIKFSDQHRDCVKTCKIVRSELPKNMLKVSNDDLAMAVLSAASLYVTFANKTSTRTDSLRLFHPRFGKFTLSLTADGEIKNNAPVDPERERFIRENTELRRAVKVMLERFMRHDSYGYKAGDCNLLTTDRQRQRWRALANRDIWWSLEDSKRTPKKKAKRRRRSSR